MAERRLTVTGPLKEALNRLRTETFVAAVAHWKAEEPDAAGDMLKDAEVAMRGAVAAEQALLRLLDEMMAEAVHRGGRHTDMLTEQRLGREVSGIRETGGEHD